MYGNRCGEKLFCNRMVSATLKLRREMGPKFVPQGLLGSFPGTCRSGIGQFFSMSLVTVPEVFAKVNTVQFLFRCKKFRVHFFCRRVVIPGASIVS